MKTKLSYKEQIAHMKSKGISFNEMSELQAEQYLRENNNFFKLYSYRKNYQKDKTGTKYVHLDFGELVDLAIIDMYLRIQVLEMALDIEHSLKVKILRIITEDSTEDGYSIVQDFKSFLPDIRKEHLFSELNRNVKSPYCRDAYKKYEQNLPIWVFLEIISFGTLISFYKFYMARFKTKYCEPNATNRKANAKAYRRMKKEFYMLLTVKYIRNASAHNNCILNDLKEKSSATWGKNEYEISSELKKIGLSSIVIKNKLSNERIQQIVTCLYAYKTIVLGDGMRNRATEKLHNLSNRFYQKHNYTSNSLLLTTFDTLKLIIDMWFPMVYHNSTRKK